MSIQYVILGFLKEGAKSGYSLKKEIVAVPFFHSSANNNQIYKALLSLHRAGLVDVTLHVKERGAASKVYSITAQGETELSTWVSAPPEGAEYYSDFHQQLAFAHRLSQHELVILFEGYEAKTSSRLAIAQEMSVRFGRAQQTSSDDPAMKRHRLLWSAIFEQRRQVYELELAWIRQTKRTLLALYTNAEGGDHV